MSAAIHYADTLNGNVFSSCSTPAGLAIPVYTATAIANSQPLFNPPGSNRNIELISFDLDYVSGTAVYGGIFMMGLPLTAIASGALCTAFAQTTPQNGILGGGNASKAYSSNAGTVTVTGGTSSPPASTAPGVIRTLANINLEAQTGTAHGTTISQYVFNGTVIVPPGYMVYFVSTIATSALYATTLVWAEYTIIPGQG